MASDPAASMSLALKGDAAVIGQVFTPEPVAEYLAQVLLRGVLPNAPVRVLDPGAGPGTLARALLDNAARREIAVEQVIVVESDPAFIGALLDLRESDLTQTPSIEVLNEDFIGFAKTALLKEPRFSHVIMNPPYMKLGAGSDHANQLAQLGVRATNYYAAFLWLAIELLQPGGHLAAILPRSFMNGRYFASLRTYILGSTHIDLITTFQGRDLFARDSVLQEAVVIRLTKAQAASPTRFARATLNTSGIQESDSFLMPQNQYVLPPSDGSMILVPEDSSGGCRQSGQRIVEAPVVVHTGEVVDFRLRSDIRDQPTTESVPLIGSEAFKGAGPYTPMRYLEVSARTARYVHKPGFYVVVRRISPPERSPRLQAQLVDTRRLSARGAAFENHVNVISLDGGPLNQATARRIHKALSSPETDVHIRQLCGSTQINAMDLRTLRYKEEVR